MRDLTAVEVAAVTVVQCRIIVVQTVATTASAAAQV
jgi:hypothetical protein